MKREHKDPEEGTVMFFSKLLIKLIEPYIQQKGKKKI